MVPRKYPCSPLVYDETNPSDPYWQNPLIPAKFVNFTSWKNRVNGAIVEQAGGVQFLNFKVADNLVGGIEFSMTFDTADGNTFIDGALIIGNSANANPMPTPQFRRVL